jgi:anti-anti-sigma regulatory factor
MLKITNRATADEDRWILCGQLAGLWVAELRSNWDQEGRRSQGRRCVIDLSDVTHIDKSGERLLGELKCEGAEFVAKGMYTRHLLDNLNSTQSQVRGER